MSIHPIILKIKHFKFLFFGGAADRLHVRKKSKHFSLNLLDFSKVWMHIECLLNLRTEQKQL